MMNPGSKINTLNLGQAAAHLQAELTGDEVNFSRVSINTRTLQPGDLFVAIRGEHFDAHQFLKQAEEKGACGLIVATDISSSLPLIKVRDTRLALGQIAALWRSCFSLPVIAVTGSCGKTSVKEMIGAILKIRYGNDVLLTQGNLNNDIGVPLTLMRLAPECRAAVIEMGANHQGEIAYLTDLVQPDIAVITNSANAHIEGFGSIEGVARAKGEIYSGLVRGGTAIINADDVFADYWIKSCQTINQQTSRQISIKTFAINNPADIRGTYAQAVNGLDIGMHTEQGSISLKLSQRGKHNVYNALAAAAVALAEGCELKDIKRGLEDFQHVSGRLEQKQGLNHSIIFDDTYNANPDSVKAGIEAIHQMQGNTMVILGDMGELGKNAEAMHYQLGQDIAELDIAQLYTVGNLSQAISEGFKKSRTKNQRPADVHFFSSKDELIKTVRKKINSSSVLLIKGSRSMGMEKVVAALESSRDEKANGQNSAQPGSHSCC